MPINILYLLSVLRNIEAYIAYHYCMAHPDMAKQFEKYSCVLNQSGSCGDTFEIDTRNGLPKMRVTGTFCDLDVIFCKRFFYKALYTTHNIEN